MEIKKQGFYIKFSDKVKYYRSQLKNTKTLLLSTLDHLEHICAYVAWQEVGGNIFVQSPLMPQAHKDYFKERIANLDYEDTVFIPTSGTTSMPKIIANDKKYFETTSKITIDYLNWNKDSKFINFVPAPTSGFWHAFMPAVVHTDSEITLGSIENLRYDLLVDASHLVMVPALVDIIKNKIPTQDFSKFDTIGIGSAQVLDRQVNFLFDNGCKELTHIYGITEAGVPLLHNKSTSASLESRLLTLCNDYGIQTKLKNNELLIKGATLCNNVEELGTDEGWYRTGDLFEEVNNKILFKGRINDIVKINGYKTNLLAIENLVEELTNITECIAVPKIKLGVEYLQLNYVGDIGNTHSLKNKLSTLLPKYNIPKKFTKIDKVPRNTLNKKIRS